MAKYTIIIEPNKPRIVRVHTKSIEGRDEALARLSRATPMLEMFEAELLKSIFDKVPSNETQSITE